MNKSCLIDFLYARYPDAGRRFWEEAVHVFFQEIKQALISHYRVELRGFGTFCLRERSAHAGRNPSTGDLIPIPRKFTPFFRAGKKLKEYLNQPQQSSPKKAVGSASSTPSSRTRSSHASKPEVSSFCAYL